MVVSLLYVTTVDLLLAEDRREVRELPPCDKEERADRGESGPRAAGNGESGHNIC